MLNINGWASAYGDDYLKQYLQLCHENRPCVQAHKNKLGKQNYCWNGEFRFWIWETESWRVFVSNTKGICFEVLDSLSYEEAWNTWKDYLNRMKFNYNPNFLKEHSQ